MVGAARPTRTLNSATRFSSNNAFVVDVVVVVVIIQTNETKRLRFATL